MATVTVRFDADISEAKKQLKELQETGAKTQAALNEGKSTDRRAALEGVRSAKEQLAAAEKEKAAVQEKIKAQAQAVREAQAAVNAAKEGTKEHEQAARALERQQKAFEAIKQAGTMRGQAVDQAQVNLSGARKLAAMTPRVEPAPALSGFARIREAGLNAARRVASGFANMRARIASAFSGLSGAVSGALAFLGINAGIHGLRQMIQDLDNLSKSARALGVDTTNFQKLSYAAQSMNVDFQGVQMGLAMLQKTIGEAANGSAQAAAKFARIGLSLADLKGKSASEQFDIVARAINSLSTQEEKAAAAAEMFGRSGVKLLDFLRQYKSLGDELEAKGGIIDDAQLKAAEEFDQALTNIKNTLIAIAANSGALRGLSNMLGEAAYYWSGQQQRDEDKAAEQGTYNRRTGVAFALQHAAKNGLMSQSQLDLAAKFADFYAGGTTASNSGTEAAYTLIDRALKDAGLGALARTGKDWSGSAATVSVAGEADPEKKELAQFRRRAEAWAAEQAKQQQAAEFQARLDRMNSGNTAQTRDEAIAERVKQAEKLAESMGQVLSAEQREQVVRAAGAKWDEAEAKREAGITDYIDQLNRRYKLQQMIAQGRGREAAIEERLAEARKKAADAGRELTDEETAAVELAAGQLYDAEQAKRATGPGRIGQDEYATYALRSVGGLIEGASRVGTMAQDYPRQSAETLKDLQAQVSEIKAKLPERTEAGTTRLVL